MGRWEWVHLHLTPMLPALNYDITEENIFLIVTCSSSEKSTAPDNRDSEYSESWLYEGQNAERRFSLHCVYNLYYNHNHVYLPQTITQVYINMMYLKHHKIQKKKILINYLTYNYNNFSYLFFGCSLFASLLDKEFVSVVNQHILKSFL